LTGDDPVNERYARKEIIEENQQHLLDSWHEFFNG
jgi:hypothetical protein